MNSSPAGSSTQLVGPVLQTGATATAVVDAICAANPATTVVDRGSYVRVLAKDVCRVSRGSIEAELGRPFVLPQDLEAVMVSFRGKLVIVGDDICWV